MNLPPPRRVTTAVLVWACALAVAGALPAASQPAGAPARRPAAPASDRASAHADAPVRPGEVIVKTRRGRSLGLQRALDRVGGRAAASLAERISVVEVTPGRERATAARLAADPAVVYAEPNYVRFAASHVDAEMGWGIRRTRASALWRRTPAITGAGIRVAVLDSGVDRTASDLGGRVAHGYDLYGTSGKDECGHGTAVAGVVAASHDGDETAGVAPSATIVPVKVLEFDESFGLCGGDDAAIVRGIRWAAQAQPDGGGADIINMSLSGPQRSRALRDAVVYAASRGVLVVAAAGNSGDRTVNYPAAYPQVVSVGGMQRDGRGSAWWPQSSFGAVDVVAAARNVPILTAREIQDRPWMVGSPCQHDRFQLCADGTSFAAPHVAGTAALLWQQHPELASMAPGARLRRLRQWLLGTAPRVGGTSPGMDLRAGHGQVDALGAAGASVDPAAVLLTWQAAGRVLAPTSLMTATPWQLRMQVIATRGTGAGLGDQRVEFDPSSGGSVSPRSTITSPSGRAEVVFSSRADGRLNRLTATVAGASLAVDSYVLDRDDNVPGQTPPASPFYGRLRLVDDVDDVFRFPLYAGETLHAAATGVDPRRERIVLFLHRGSTRDVTNPYLAPLPEDGTYGDDPQRLRVTVSDRGVRYLDVYGYGTYRLRWWIYVPRRVNAIDATPRTITPNRDGRAESSRITWRSRRAGLHSVVIRGAGGAVVRRVNLGQLSDGAHAYRWGGRNQRGNYVGSGRYSARVEWNNGRGRRSWATTRISVRR